MPKTIHRPEYAVIASMLREARQRTGLLQIDVAIALGKSQSFVSDVEHGARRLDLLELRDLCVALDLEFVTFVAIVEKRLQSASPAPKKHVRRVRSKSKGTK